MPETLEFVLPKAFEVSVPLPFPFVEQEYNAELMGRFLFPIISWVGFLLALLGKVM